MRSTTVNCKKPLCIPYIVKMLIAEDIYRTVMTNQLFTKPLVHTATCYNNLVFMIDLLSPYR